MSVFSALDLGGGDRNTIALLQHLVGSAGLAIDADQVILRGAFVGHLVKEFRHGGSVRDLAVIGEASAVVIDDEYLHIIFFLCLQSVGDGCTSLKHGHRR